MDHCRIISVENGADTKAVFARFAQLSNAVKASLLLLQLLDIGTHVGGRTSFLRRASP